MLRLIFFIGLKDERLPSVTGGTVGWTAIMGVMGPNSSSALLDGWDNSSRAAVAANPTPAASPEDSVSSLLRLEVENPLGERIWGEQPRPSLSFNEKVSAAGLGWLEDCNEGVQQMDSSL